jgi:biofilm protein TabA
MFIGLLADEATNKATLPAALTRALNVLKTQDLATMEPGRYEVEGDKLFYLVQDAMPRAVDACQTEIHRNYLDIQIPVSARERFGFSVPQADLVSTDDRLESHDIAFFPTPANEYFMDLDPGTFAVFYPGELHRPCVQLGEQKPFRKVVVKVHKSLLGL